MMRRMSRSSQNLDTIVSYTQGLFKNNAIHWNWNKPFVCPGNLPEYRFTSLPQVCRINLMGDSFWMTQHFDSRKRFHQFACPPGMVDVNMRQQNIIKASYSNFLKRFDEIINRAQRAGIDNKGRLSIPIQPGADEVVSSSDVLGKGN